ncbi:hypothetical protein [Actinoplanes subglobosus]|uniref:Uncharacterized protein n=1 Tax=Actinoplanes subglobosus TaxID=1547892 RepID=A0ABV8J371_9ACTN
MSANKEFVAWLMVSSAKLTDPDAIVSCPNEDGGLIEASYLEVDGTFVEAHLYCTACDRETWVRNPRQPTPDQAARVTRYPK